MLAFIISLWILAYCKVCSSIAWFCSTSCDSFCWV